MSTVDSDGDGTKDDDEPLGVKWAFHSMTDSSGNALYLSSAPTVTSDNSKVEIDTRVPEVLEISLATDNDNSSWGQATDQLTMSIRTSEPVRTLDVTDLGLSSGLEGMKAWNGKQWQPAVPQQADLSPSAFRSPTVRVILGIWSARPPIRAWWNSILPRRRFKI